MDTGQASHLADMVPTKDLQADMAPINRQVDTTNPLVDTEEANLQVDTVNPLNQPPQGTDLQLLLLQAMEGVNLLPLPMEADNPQVVNPRATGDLHRKVRVDRLTVLVKSLCLKWSCD